MAGKAWSEQRKREVLERFALVDNYAAVSREFGVPSTTVARWCKENAPEIERIRARNKEIAEKVIQQTLEERMAEIAQFGEQLRERARELLGRRVVKVTPGGIASLARAGVDIELRALGEPTESIELRGKILDECIERELARLATPGEEGATDHSGESQ